MAAFLNDFLRFHTTSSFHHLNISDLRFIATTIQKYHVYKVRQISFHATILHDDSLHVTDMIDLLLLGEFCHSIKFWSIFALKWRFLCYLTRMDACRKYFFSLFLFFSNIVVPDPFQIWFFSKTLRQWPANQTFPKVIFSRFSRFYQHPWTK